MTLILNFGKTNIIKANLDDADGGKMIIKDREGSYMCNAKNAM